MEQLPLGVQLRERASFEGFVTGHNLEAVTRVQAAALLTCARAGRADAADGG